ncbi:hypothetical protein GBA65_01370 [Rubrobacter marinus]|uniref:Uncharacterized protein n=1 Tax=Rubrobacter marinus TaxID=2653852 RepID=A0A6G8PTW4_9ACTN|nr:hypothetical protein [Rubrobacter marinus]QIN77381.1 hypothetical protein GBA65_01370 [Rubrobacter marinus]
MAGRDRLVAALLTVALLLCHGALGALHQSPSQPAGQGAGGHHVSAAGSSAEDHHAKHHEASLAHADYAAALFVVLLGTALALFLGRFPARGLAVAPRLFWRVFLPLFLRPPRGPTPPLLQVFRL